MISKKRLSSRRNGAATVELAVCLPVILIIVLGAIEAASLLYARQAAVQASYEAAIVAIRHDGTNSAAISAANQVAKGRKIEGMSVSFRPANVASVPRGEVVIVTATIPAGSNRLINSRMIGVDRVSARAVMVKE